MEASRFGATLNGFIETILVRAIKEPDIWRWIIDSPKRSENSSELNGDEYDDPDDEEKMEIDPEQREIVRQAEEDVRRIEAARQPKPNGESRNR